MKFINDWRYFSQLIHLFSLCFSLCLSESVSLSLSL